MSQVIRPGGAAMGQRCGGEEDSSDLSGWEQASHLSGAH